MFFRLFFLFKVDGELWDLERPLEKSCKLELLDFEHPEGKCRRFLFCLSGPIKVSFYTFYYYFRKKGLLAFFCACSGRGCRETLWLPSMSRSSNWWWIFLRDGYWGTVSIYLLNSLIYLFSYVLLYRPVTNADYPALEKVSESAIKEKQKFERLVVSKEKLLEMFNVRQLFWVFLFWQVNCSAHILVIHT